MRIALALLLAGCATGPARHAETFHKRGHIFHGPRQMTITSGDDADDLEASLSQFNFRVSRQLPGVLTSLSSRYVISSKGFCGPGGTTARYAQRVAADYSADVRLLSVDVFDSETNERVFAAHLDNDDGCPYAFFSEVAAALARNWEDGEVEGPASRDR